jgi:hypothetical protein
LFFSIVIFRQASSHFLLHSAALRAVAECTAWLHTSSDYLHAAMQAAFEALPMERISKVSPEHIYSVVVSRCLHDGIILFRTYPSPPLPPARPYPQDGAITLRNICAACHDQIAADERLDAYVCRAAELLPSLWYVGACR